MRNPGSVRSIARARRAARVPLALTLGLLIATVLLPGLAWARQAEPPAEASSLLVTWQTADAETFQAVVSDPASIERITDALAGDGYAGIPNGALAHGDGGVNAPHAWHLLDVMVVDVTIELCDGTASMVDADVDYWVDVVGRFCPWSAIVLAAEPLQVGPPAVSPTLEPTATGIAATPPRETPTAPMTVEPAVTAPVQLPPATAPAPALPPATLVAAPSPPLPATNSPTLKLPDTGTGTAAGSSSPIERLAGASTVIVALLGAVATLSSRRGRPGPSEVVNSR